MINVNRLAFADEIWDQNYRAPGEATIENTWERIARACASVEKEEIAESVYEDFLWLLTDFKGITGGRITANIGVSGRESTSLMNCFVHSPGDMKYKDPDSISGIYDMLKAQAHTLKSEGGYGMNFSWIRPAGTYVAGIDGRTPGVLAFMNLWNESSRIITMGSEKILGNRKQGEKKKIRKGAQMAILNCWHPEIEDFIEAKQVEGRFDKFNISVGITEGFMGAVENDDNWCLKFPDTECKEYEEKWDGDIESWEKCNLPVIEYKTIKARYLWEKIMKSTYSRNDPGVLFLDVANKLNPLKYAETVKTTNPCGEINMSLGVCLLSSLNLVKFVKESRNGFEFDYETFGKAVDIVVRMADNINDISRVPLPEYQISMKEKRRIGIGVLGLGSLHFMLGIKYGSKESLKLTKKIFKIKAEHELLASAKLGKEKGSFPLFQRDKYFNSYWWKTLPISKNIKEEIEKIGEMRNSHRSANAPTGNMSIYAGVVSGGIEPVIFKNYGRWSIVPEFMRTELSEQGFKFPNFSKSEWFETDTLKETKIGTDVVLMGSFNGDEYQYDKNRGLTKKTIVEDFGWSFVKLNYNEQQISEMENRGVFATSEELSINEHIEVLKVISKYIDMNSSKTVNIPNEYKYEEFKNLYFNAWKNNIKGITSYRAGTMTAVLEKSENNVSTVSTDNFGIVYTNAPKRPKELPCDVHIAKVNGQKWAVFVGLMNNQPYEIFAGPESNIDFKISKNDNTKIVKDGRGIYNFYINKNKIKNIVEKLDDVETAWATRLISTSLRHGVPLNFICQQLGKDGFITDANMVISRILKKYIKKDVVQTCPCCDSHNCSLTEGCFVCFDCGYGKCG